MTLRADAPDRTSCAGCGGSGRCWVCAGRGTIATAGEEQLCSACGGRTTCRVCDAAHAPEMDRTG